MTRHEILTQDNPARLWAIIDESVLRRQVGNPQIMQAQCQYLLSMSRGTRLEGP